MSVPAVVWFDWDENAFEKARTEGRLILLYLSASWCHWCHVMEEDTLAHPEVVRKIAAHYVPIRVDSDKRPDINGRYNMGGWPTVAILTPEGEPLAGETYLPTGPFLQLLHQAQDSFQKDRGVVESRARDRIHLRESLRPTDDRTERPDPEAVQKIGLWLERTYDSQFGGFMGPMKFPMPSVLELAMLLYRRTGRKEWLRMFTATLDGMRDGGINDPVDGGFFRYSTSDDWDQPHYEKMLETQAGLLVSYLLGYQATEDPRYRATAREIVRYATDSLWVEEGPWFGGSQSADAEYYRSEPEKRDELPPPPVDRTLYTHWNAMMIRALLKASAVLEEPELETRALRVLEAVLGRCLNDGPLAVHYHDGQPSSFGLLSDQVWLLLALTEAYEMTGEQRHLETAHSLLEETVNRYWDPEAGCFLDRSSAPEERGLLSQPLYSLEENARMAQALLKFSVWLGREDFRDRAGKTLSFFSAKYDSYRLGAAPYAPAVDGFYRPLLTVTIVSPFGDPKRQALARAAMRLSEPWKVVEHLDAEIDAHRIERRGYPRGGEAAAYLCVGRVCKPPVHRPEELSKAAESFRTEEASG